MQFNRRGIRSAVFKERPTLFVEKNGYSEILWKPMIASFQSVYSVVIITNKIRLFFNALTKLIF